MINRDYTDEEPRHEQEIEINTPTGKIKAVSKRYGTYDIYVLDLHNTYVLHKKINIRPNLSTSCKNIYEVYMSTYENNKEQNTHE
jgi:hypothetical protein